MNIQFLGDALDYWKGFILSRLQKGGILHDFAVDPMLTDAEKWDTADFQLYADLLQIRPDQVLRHKARLHEDRDKYFAEIRHSGDLFVDPDTGMTLRGARCEHIKIREVCQLLGEKSPRILCIYQHIRYRTRDRVNRLVSALRECDANIYSFSYESRTVAMLFLSRKQGRIERVERYFKDYFGRHADVRGKIWR